MKKVVLILVVSVCWICFYLGFLVGRDAGYETAWADYERGFNDGIKSPHNVYKRPLQTSEFQWRGSIEELAKVLCEREGIAYEVNEPTLGYKIVCPKCSCGGALYQKGRDAALYYGFHHRSELEELNAEESVNLGKRNYGQTYCAKCLYPLGTDWKIIDLSDPNEVKSEEN